MSFEMKMELFSLKDSPVALGMCSFLRMFPYRAGRLFVATARRATAHTGRGARMVCRELRACRVTDFGVGTRSTIFQSSIRIMFLSCDKKGDKEMANSLVVRDRPSGGVCSNVVTKKGVCGGFIVKEFKRGIRGLATGRR